jgi:hypothetical protein
MYTSPRRFLLIEAEPLDVRDTERVSSAAAAYHVTPIVASTCIPKVIAEMISSRRYAAIITIVPGYAGLSFNPPNHRTGEFCMRDRSVWLAGSQLRQNSERRGMRDLETKWAHEKSLRLTRV